MGRFGILVAGIAALAAPVWYRLFSVPAAWKPVIHLADFLAGIAAAALFEYCCASVHPWLAIGYLLYVPRRLRECWLLRALHPCRPTST